MASDQDQRCAATFRGARCVLLAGHGGDHRTTWRDEESDGYVPCGKPTPGGGRCWVRAGHAGPCEAPSEFRDYKPTARGGDTSGAVLATLAPCACGRKMLRDRTATWTEDGEEHTAGGCTRPVTDAYGYRRVPIEPAADVGPGDDAP